MHNTKEMEFELIEDVLKGNTLAFDELIKPYIKPMYNISYKILNSEEDAKDVCQEALIKVFKNLKNFKMNARFFTWVYRITVNCSKDLIQKRYKNLGLSLDEELEDTGDYILYHADESQVTPESLLDKKMLYDEILQTIEGLPINCRTAIVLRDIEGFSYAEIAEIMEMKLNTVKSHINRARKLAVKDLLNKGIVPSSYERKYLNE